MNNKLLSKVLSCFIFGLTVFFFWSIKITANADYYFTLENNVLTTTSADEAAVQNLASAQGITFPHTFSDDDEFSFSQLGHSTGVHLTVIGSNTMGKITGAGNTFTLDGSGSIYLYWGLTSQNSTNMIIEDVTLSTHTDYGDIRFGDNLTINSGNLNVKYIGVDQVDSRLQQITVNGGKISAKYIASDKFTMNSGYVNVWSIRTKQGHENSEIHLNGGTVNIYCNSVLGDSEERGIWAAADGTFEMAAWMQIVPAEYSLGLKQQTDTDITSPEYGYPENVITILDEDGKYPRSYKIIETVHSDWFNRNHADDGYELTTSVSDVDLAQQPESYTVISNGTFSEFKDLYLDGSKLERNVDYTAESGSTRITIQSQTLALNPSQHSLLLEFRKTDTEELRTASQLFTVTDSSPSQTGGTSQGNTGSSSQSGSGNENQSGSGSENQSGNSGETQSGSGTENHSGSASTDQTGGNNNSGSQSESSSAELTNNSTGNQSASSNNNQSNISTQNHSANNQTATDDNASSVATNKEDNTSPIILHTVLLADGTYITITDQLDEARFSFEYADPGYELEMRIPVINTDQLATIYEIKSHGELSEFKNVYLDGIPLQQNVDYTATSGSTILHIQPNVLAIDPAVHGQWHSLTMEFRTPDTNELRTASQVFMVTSSAIEANNQSFTQDGIADVEIATPILNATENILHGTLLDNGTYLVGKQDNLSLIARVFLEAESKWKQLYLLNEDTINDPDLIYIGQVIKLH